MNTYNENLRSSVTKTLDTLDADLKKVNANANAAMFTLYYAQGATFTAMGELEKSKEVESLQEAIKTQAVNNSNLSTNLMNTATQAGTYMKQSVANVSVCASNVQSSANAVVRLAGEVGNIFNIINAADYDTDIYKLALEANSLINETAYDAELASQLALESSVYTSKVTAQTVQDNSKTTNDAVNSLLKIVSDDFNKISQRVNDNNSALATVSTTEKAAEGAYEDLRNVSQATAEAYDTTNDQLNLELTASVVPGSENSQFEVAFQPITSPFPERDKKGSPVQEYILFMVSDKKKSTFSVNTAEDIRANYPNRFINLTAQVKPGVKFSAEFDYEAIPAPGGSQDSTGAATTYALEDSDGNAIGTGTDYVVFLYAVYTEEYKKKLNSYDDYLSAPSTTLTFTIVLKTAQFAADSGTAPAAEAGSTTPSYKEIKFNVNETNNITAEYRCAFLPVATPATLGMMDEEMLSRLDAEIERLKNDAETLQPAIDEVKASLLKTSDEESQFREKYASIFGSLQQFILQNASMPKATLSAKKQDDSTKQLMAKMKASIPELADPSPELKEDLPKMMALLPARQQDEAKLASLQQQKTATLKSIEAANNNKIDFIFNLQLALGLTAGSYTVAENGTSAGENAGTDYTVTVMPNTTDNFGNVLVAGKSYIPVVISVATEESMLSSFTNSWTGIGAHKPITI